MRRIATMGHPGLGQPGSGPETSIGPAGLGGLVEAWGLVIRWVVQVASHPGRRDTRCL